MAPGQTGSETAALDLTAETFAQAWHRIQALQGHGRRLGSALAVRHREQPRAPIPQAQPDRDRRPRRLGLPLAFAECEDYERVDERIAATRWVRRCSWRSRALPTEQRRALELRIVEQLDYEEVAGRLGCSQNAARLRVSRGLRALTLELDEERRR